MSPKLSLTELRGAISLKMHRKAISLLLDSGESLPERVFDRFTGAFTDITCLAVSLLKSIGYLGGSLTFTLDLGVVTPLYMTARKCSDVALRRHAI